VVVGIGLAAGEGVGDGLVFSLDMKLVVALKV
jgi:hypothetical protein